MRLGSDDARLSWSRGPEHEELATPSRTRLAERPGVSPMCAIWPLGKGNGDVKRMRVRCGEADGNDGGEKMWWYGVEVEGLRECREVVSGEGVCGEGDVPGYPRGKAWQKCARPATPCAAVDAEQAPTRSPPPRGVQLRSCVGSGAAASTGAGGLGTCSASGAAGAATCPRARATRCARMPVLESARKWDHVGASGCGVVGRVA